MNIKFPLLAIFLVGSLIISCDKDKDPITEESISPIVETDLPETGNVGQEIIFTVRHAVFNGCGYYSSQNTVKDGLTFSVTFYAKYRDGFCTMNVPTLGTDYKFVPSTSGTYTFKFDRGEQEDLVQSIIIN